jgi:hypothetical protein
VAYTNPFKAPDYTTATNFELTAGGKINPYKIPITATQANYFDLTPGAPYWWLNRLSRTLFGRQQRYDELENYAIGDHPLPNGDVRYVKALRELQYKARTNYIALVIKAVTGRMHVRGFRFGPTGSADVDAMKIWNANDLDNQSPMNLNTAAVFGLTYGLVSPPVLPGGEPRITIEDPRMCVTERDPLNYSRSLAGIKMWRDSVHNIMVAQLYLPATIYTFYAYDSRILTENKEARISTDLDSRPHANRFTLASEEPNVLGEVPLVEGNWQPAFGPLGRAEAEDVLDIQDRINYQVLTRLVVSKSQAYRQRWATGLAPLPSKDNKKAPPFDPGADMLWVSSGNDTKFGDFEQADIRQALEAVRDDVGDMAAITQTPASYLMNRMVNVSGSAIVGDQGPLVQKIHMREAAMGWFYEQLIKFAFAYKNDPRATDVEATTLWADPELRSQAEQADALNKFVISGVPLEIAMTRAGFTPDEITFAVKKAEEATAKADAAAAHAEDHAIKLATLAKSPVATETTAPITKPTA